MVTRNKATSIALLVLITFALASGAAKAESPWPMFRHDVRHTGQSPYVGAQSDELQWKCPTGTTFHSFSPAIASNGTIYARGETSVGDTLYAVSSTGSIKWRFQPNVRRITYSSPAVGSDGTIYISFIDYEGSYQTYLYAIDSEGAFKWKYPTGSYKHSNHVHPVIGPDGTIYVRSGTADEVLAINPDGTMKWKYYVEAGWLAASPTIGIDGSVYIASGADFYLYAVRPDSTLNWKFFLGNPPSPACAVGDNGTIYVGCAGEGLYALNPNGTLKWQCPGPDYKCPPSVMADGTIVVGTTTIDPNGNLLNWGYPVPLNTTPASSPAIGADGTIYIGSSNGKLYAVTTDGALKWSYITGGKILSSPAIGSNGTIYVGSDDCNLYAFGGMMPHFNLTFPLQNRNAYNARITAVFDHSMVDSYCPDDKMVTYSGEETTEKTPYSPIDPIGCGPLYSFYKPGGGAFLVGKVNYVGIRSEENNLVLQYDAHPGYDYPDDLGTPVLAAAEGDLSVVNETCGWVKIIHDGVGAGYETHYLHLNSHIDPGRVARGQVIGEVGSKGESSGNHLHFEVRYNGIPVDPYGWEGSGTDPYTTLTGAVNVRLWETLDTTNPWIDYLLGSPADMVVTDPDGLHISKDLNQIPRAAYDEVDIDGDGDLEDRVSILHKKVGEYLIDVIPESNALPTDTYSLEAVIEGQTMVLAEDVLIQDIPPEPYRCESKLNRSDFDSDGDVDLADLAMLCLHWLQQDCNYPNWCEGTDLNYNGFVDFIDFAIFADNWLWEKIPADFNIDGVVDFADYATFALYWMDIDCTEPNWCDGTDLNKNGSVDWYDLAKFAEHWLEDNR